MNDVIMLTALEQAALVARGEVSAEELTRAALDRIAALDPSVSAFVQLRPGSAIRAARRLDAERRKNPNARHGPLFGLPTGMKDLHLTRGFFARMGSRAFRYLWSPFDDVTSRTIRSAGMVILGKLGTSELALLPIVETDIHPPVRNPWDLTRTAGGSSGGSGAAVGAGMIPLAAASDGAGSIRIPASFCGLVGHKSTRGLVPNPHAHVETVGLSVIGPHARTVDDAAALLDVLTGRGSFAKEARIPPRALKISFTTHSPLGPVEPAVVRAVEEIAALAESMGHHVAEGANLEGRIEEFLPMYQFLAHKSPVLSARVLQPATRWLRESGRGITHAQAMVQRRLFEDRVAAWFGDVDIWITPTVACGPPAVHAFRDVPGDRALFEVAHLGAFTAAFNAGGQPATTIPIWRDDSALPIGVQLVGRIGDDARLLAMARALMEARGDLRGRIAPLTPLSTEASRRDSRDRLSA